MTSLWQQVEEMRQSAEAYASVSCDLEWVFRLRANEQYLGELKTSMEAGHSRWVKHRLQALVNHPNLPTSMTPDGDPIYRRQSGTVLLDDDGQANDGNGFQERGGDLSTYQQR